MSSWTSGEILSKDKLNEMEDNLSSVTSTYNKTIWNDEDIVTANKLNNLENGISTFIPTYSKHTWVNDEEITAVDLNNIDISQKSFEVGDVVVKDGIESVCVYKEEARQDWGQYLFVDKGHDLSYYITGLDYVNNNDYITSPGTFGYEWGEYGTSQEMTDSSYQEIGKGLSNTNTLISKNLTPNTSGWRVLWDMIEEFRVSHSDDWFIPSTNELSLIYSRKEYLVNISTKTNPGYWASSELNSDSAYIVSFNTGILNYSSKDNHYRHSRLCFYL